MIDRIKFQGHIYVKIVDVEERLINIAEGITNKSEPDIERLALNKMSVLTLGVITDFLAKIRDVNP